MPRSPSASCRFRQRGQAPVRRAGKQHRDAGRLIEDVYIHRNPEQARARMKKAIGYNDQDRD
jgi:hypothetical protein